MAPDDTDGVVVEAHPNTVGLTDEISIFYVDFAVNQRVPDCALDVELAFAEAFEADYLVGNEAVGQCQREAVHREDGIYLAVALVLVGAA